MALSRRRVALVGLVVLLVPGVGILVVSWESAGELLHPARLVDESTPGDFGLGWENVSLATEDGVTLSAWWIPSEEVNLSRPTVVFLHGYGDAKAQALPYAAFLHAAGHPVLAFDFRAHGASGGEYTTVGYLERRDVAAAVAHVQERGEFAGCSPECPVGLVGLSMGAATAINSAPDLPQVQAVVVDSPFATLKGLVGTSISHFTGLPEYPFGPLSVALASLRVGLPVSENAPVREIARLDRPVLIIHGLDDTVVPPENAERLSEAAGGPVDVWLVPGAAHVAAHSVAAPEYEGRVLRFLTDAFS